MRFFRQILAPLPLLAFVAFPIAAQNENPRFAQLRNGMVETLSLTLDIGHIEENEFGSSVEYYASDDSFQMCNVDVSPSELSYHVGPEKVMQMVDREVLGKTIKSYTYDGQRSGAKISSAMHVQQSDDNPNMLSLYQINLVSINGKNYQITEKCAMEYGTVSQIENLIGVVFWSDQM